ncbi:MAG: AAA family ATPase [Clostridia bacterium]|nr:AAA family ATPase [Clostridia bacterium]
MNKIISIVNQKGGVGKTTTAVNLSAALGELGKKILLVDIDPQGNSTSGLGFSKKDLTFSSYDLLMGEEDVSKIIQPTKFKNLFLLPADMNLAGAELELVDMKKREARLKIGLSKIREQFDFIFLDCPPSLGLITLNALTSSDSFMVPIQCEYYALEGLSQLMATVRTVKKLYNSDLDLEGVLLTMYDSRLNLTRMVVEEVKRFFPKKVFATVIPRNVRLSEAPSFGMPIGAYDSSSSGADSYRKLAKEFIKNNK